MCSATGEYIKHRMLLLYDEKSLEEGKENSGESLERSCAKMQMVTLLSFQPEKTWFQYYRNPLIHFKY